CTDRGRFRSSVLELAGLRVHLIRRDAKDENSGFRAASCLTSLPCPASAAFARWPAFLTQIWLATAESQCSSTGGYDPDDCSDCRQEGREGEENRQQRKALDGARRSREGQERCPQARPCSPAVRSRARHSGGSSARRRLSIPRRQRRRR